ncbi:MAG: biotin transporter BioY [Anaerovoracaceae bacterium]|jgi:biotin transport system substrate-specific component
MKKSRISIKDICTISILTVATTVMAQISIPLPFTPVPISFGLVAVYMTGILLSPRHGAFAQITYLLLGAVGLPVFANFKGGLGALLGPTGGFLMVFPLMSFLVSIAINGNRSLQKENVRGRLYLYVKVVSAMVLSHLILYSAGTIWFSLTTHTPFAGALMMTVIPFIPMDIIKVAFCAVVFIPFRKRLVRMGLLSFPSPA